MPLKAGISNQVLAVIKILTLLPLVALLYYDDFARWETTLVDDHLLGFFVAGLAMLAIGVLFKRNVIETYVEISEARFWPGLYLVIVALAVYIAGSYVSQYTAWLHYESLIVLIAAYLVLRFDKRLLLTLSPLFAIAGVAFVPAVTEGLLGHTISGAYTALLYVGLFALFEGNQLRPLLIPGVTSFLGLVYWLVPKIGEFSLYGLPKLSILVLIVPLIPLLYFFEQFRNTFRPIAERTPLVCESHSSSEDGGTKPFFASLFCPNCGRRVHSPDKLSKTTLGSLLFTLGILLALFFVQVPLLTMQASSPYLSQTSYSGLNSIPMAQPPAGWLVNTSSIVRSSNEIYAIEQNIVPSYHPESANYSVYYEISSSRLPQTELWNPPSNYNVTKSVFSLGPFSGYVYDYSFYGSSMMVFSGTTMMTFLTQGHFQSADVRLSIVRLYGDAGANTSSSANFQSEIDLLFLPVLQTETEYSAWSSYFFSLQSDFLSIDSIVIAIMVMGVLFSSIRFIVRSDAKTDGYLRNVSGLGEDELSFLTRLHKSPGIKTFQEIQALLAGGLLVTSSTELRSILGRLEKRKLMNRVLFERDSEVVLGWRLPF
ncbi:MAG: hypothetical protein JRN52_00650 [Nitrososphaerota archaeon]|nr:hypothetical protein [Nitrososphaerota archaeon]